MIEVLIMIGINFLNTLDSETRNSHIERRVTGVVKLIKETIAKKETNAMLLQDLGAISGSDLLLFNPSTIVRCTENIEKSIDPLCKHLLNISPYITPVVAKQALFSAMQLYSEQISYLAELDGDDVEDWHRAHFMSLTLDTVVVLLTVRNMILVDPTLCKTKNIFTRLKFKRLRDKLFIH